MTRVDTGIAQYFGVGAYLRDLPDVRHSRVGFAAECLAFSNLTDPVVPGGVPRDNGADWDFADVREHYLRQRYGADATEADAQRVTGEVMADVFGEWRRPDSGCGGGIVLWLRDVVPGRRLGAARPRGPAQAGRAGPGADPAADRGLVRGRGAERARRARGERRPRAARGHARRSALLREDGSPGESAAVEVARAGRTATTSPASRRCSGRFADVTYAYRFGPPQHAGVRARLVTVDGVAREAVWKVPLTSLR